MTLFNWETNLLIISYYLKNLSSVYRTQILILYNIKAMIINSYFSGFNIYIINFFYKAGFYLEYLTKEYII